MLPPGLLPVALAPGIAVGKKLGLKAVPGLLALPAVSLAMVALTFLGALRSLRSLHGGEAVEGDPRGALVRAWWANHRKGAGVSLVVVFLLLATGHPEAVMVLLLLSMLGIVVGPWLAGIARNLLRAKRRRDGRAPAPLAEVDPPAATDGAAADPAEERRRRVRDAVERLPGELRAVVKAFYLERASTARVAALLGVSTKTVEGRLYRARAALRDVLGAPAEA